MKSILIAITALMIGLSANAQDLMVDKIDDFTGQVKKITNRYVIAKGVTTLSANVARIDDSYGIYVRSSLDLGCAGAYGNYIIFLFEDGTTIKIDNDVADIDCSGSTAMSIFVIDPSDFKGKTVKSIRLRQSELYADCSTEAGEYTINQLLEAVK